MRREATAGKREGEGHAVPPTRRRRDLLRGAWRRLSRAAPCAGRHELDPGHLADHAVEPDRPAQGQLPGRRHGPAQCRALTGADCCNGRLVELCRRPARTHGPVGARALPRRGHVHRRPVRARPGQARARADRLGDAVPTHRARRQPRRLLHHVRRMGRAAEADPRHGRARLAGLAHQHGRRRQRAVRRRRGLP